MPEYRIVNPEGKVTRKAESELVELKLESNMSGNPAIYARNLDNRWEMICWFDEEGKLALPAVRSVKGLCLDNRKQLSTY